jgi:hypothetical protein
MPRSSIARSIPLGTLVIGLAVGSAPGQGDSQGAKDEVLGGKLLAKPDPKQKGNAGPPFELSIWDVADGKELYRLKEKDAPPAYPASGPMMFRAREPIHQIDYAPSGRGAVERRSHPVIGCNATR